MSWHAVAALDDAVDATRRFLFPFSLVRWAKLALLVLLMGGSGASANVPVSFVSDTDVAPPRGMDSGVGGVGPNPATIERSVGSIDPGTLAVVAVGIGLLIVAVSVVSLSLRLVFYDAIRTNEVRIWRPFLARLRQSIGLFLFTATLSIAAAAPVALAAFVTVAGDAPIGWEPVDAVAGTLGSLSVGTAVVLGVLGAAFVAVAVLALRFTYEFVVPTMIVEETGVLGGWSRFWTTLRAEWTELVVYLLVHFVVSLGLSVVAGIAAVFAFALVATVAGLVLLLVAVALGGLGALVGTTAGAAAIALAVLAGSALLLVLLLPVQVLTQSYRIAYEVSTLGGMDPDLALLHPDLGTRASGPAGADGADSSDR
ncbi:hypothetical protein [Halorubrum sp. Hd13]|uniref:DUF7544 domain-containing protein n=1 Tax=Halorubrum sp. Hd13 TaxID=1480728 RepID=UPI000B97DD18|nr:hypothetical protein [Halorubrum sp. Hd13]OYR41897.1 hypothetical protein DJ81_11805 [Halorubrum sp. Hd13]